jgi:hypothetical protein
MQMSYMKLASEMTNCFSTLLWGEGVQIFKMRLQISINYITNFGTSFE